MTIMMNKCSAAFFMVQLLAAPFSAAEEPPVIHKRGTVQCDMVEVTPIVWQGKLYRFEYVRDNYKHNPVKQACFRFVDMESGTPTEPFALGYHLGCAFTEGDTMYVYGVKEWGANSIEVFWSKDLKTWKNQAALQMDKAKIFNTSVCKDPQGYVMAIEFGEPLELVGNGFTNLFARSKDLLAWTLCPPECVYTKERYSACPALRFLDGFYYMVYLEAYPDTRYFPHFVRSKDLKIWENSPFNPIMRAGSEDKQIQNPKLSEEERQRIAGAKNINNSDVDFCEYQGKTILYYSWGNQQGTEFLAEACYDGSQNQFLKAYFPHNGNQGTK